MYHESRKTVLLAILPCLFLFALMSCQTVKPLDTSKTDTLGVDVQQTQTQVVTESHDLGGTIDVLKTTTDAIKDTPTKEQTATIIKYVDLGSEQKTALLKTVDSMTAKIADFQKSRIQDNSSSANTIAAQASEIQALKPWQSRFWCAAAVIIGMLALIAGYVVLRVKAIIKV